MVFILVTLALVSAIAFFQALQGAFSALIMAVLTVLAAALAINFYGPLSTTFLLEHIPRYADALCLAGLFLVVLVIFRTISDNTIRGNMVLPAIPDRILAGLISLPTALLIVGIASISFQMLPFDPQVMLFRRFDPNMENRRSIFPYADQFAAAVMSGLSSGALSANNSFGHTHPDWLKEIHASRAGVQRESPHSVMPKSIKAQSAWQYTGKPLLKKKKRYDRYDPNTVQSIEVTGEYKPDPDASLIVVQTKFNSPAADSDGYYRFTPTQVRLVGFLGTGTANYFPLGMGDQLRTDEYNYIAPNHHIIAKADLYDFVFEVPENFKPWFIEYKRWARSLVPEFEQTTPQATTPTGKSQPNPLLGTTFKPGWKPQFAVEQQTRFTNQMPFSLSIQSQDTRLGQAQIRRGKFASGSLYGKIGTNQSDDLQAPAPFTAMDFEVPQNKRLLIVQCHLNRADTALLNNIFASVTKITPRYAVDKRGHRYIPVGQFVKVPLRQGGFTVELQYDPESDGMTSHPKPFRHVSVNKMRDKKITLGFLYLIPPGTEMASFDLGVGGPIQSQSLRGLTAP